MPGKTSQAGKKVHDSSKDRLNSANTRLVSLQYLVLLLLCCVVMEAREQYVFGLSGQRLNLQLKSGTLGVGVEGKAVTRESLHMLYLYVFYNPYMQL